MPTGGTGLRRIVTKAQAMRVPSGRAAITRTDDYTAWVGHEIVLSVGKAPNGMDTLVISPIPDAPTAADEAPAAA